ncbi:MAG: VCBS repeat-containing protein, partial [Polyangiales bacterium]
MLDPSGIPTAFAAPQLPSGSGRFFNITQDAVVTLRGPGTAGSTTALEALVFDGDVSGGDGSFRTLFGAQMIDAPQLTVGSLNPLIVDDFNQDGLDDILFSLDGTAWSLATATDIDDPSAGLTVTSFGTATLGTESVVSGDVDGDGFLEVFGATCPLGEPCELTWGTVCPFSAAGACAGASDEIVAPATSSMTLVSGLGKGVALAIGDFMNVGQDQVMVFTTRRSAGDAIADATLYSFETLAPKQQGTPLELISLSVGGTFNDSIDETFLHVDAGSIFPAGLADSSGNPVENPVLLEEQAAYSYAAGPSCVGAGCVPPQSGAQRGIVWWNPSIDGLATASTGFQTINTAGVLSQFGLALGHFGVPIAECTNSMGQPIECPLTNFNLQIATGFALTDITNDTTFIDILNVTDIVSQTGEVEFGVSDPTRTVIDALSPPTASDANVVAGARVLSGDFQGRGIRLGDPIVTRQTVIRPELVVASPPFHVDRLLVSNFDENTFPVGSCTTSGAAAPSWLSVSECDTQACPVTDETSCTMNFSLAIGSGNAQLSTTFVEQSGSSSMTETSHQASWSSGGSISDSFTAQTGAGIPFTSIDGYANVSASASFSDTGGKKTDNTTDSYNSYSATTTYTTGGDDVLVYVTETKNTYRYPMLGQTCSPSGGNNGCMTAPGQSEGLQYYVLTAPDQPKVIETTAAGQEWYQPIWSRGSMLSYPTNCASLAGGLSASAALDNPVMGAESFVGTSQTTSLDWQSMSGATTMTAHSRSLEEKSSVSLTVGTGCVSKPDKSGVKDTLSATQQYNRDTVNLHTATTQTSGSTGVTSQWSNQLFWDSPELNYSAQMLVYGQVSSFATAAAADFSSDPFEGIEQSEVDVRNGFVSVAYAAGLDSQSSAWWLDETKSEFYAKNIDVAVALPLTVSTSQGGNQPGEGSEQVTQCLDNGGSQKLQCAKFNAIDTTFDDLFGTNQLYFQMRGFFFSPAPPAASCTTQSDCVTGKTCTDGKCVSCTLESDCTTTQSCFNGTCVDFVNGLPSTPGDADAIIQGDDALLSVRIYNQSLLSMAQAGVENVKVQIYGQAWDSTNQTRMMSNGQPEPSFLINDETLAVSPIGAFPYMAADSCDVGDAVYNWVGTHAVWDTTGATPGDYLFWVVAWAEDAEGNVVSELPLHGVCPAAAGAQCRPCPGATCTWMTDVNLET